MVSAFSQGSGTAALNFGGGTFASAGPWSSAVNVNLSGIAGPATFDTTGGGISLLGNLTGTGGLVKTGPGTLTLSGTGSFTGATTVNSGVLTAFGLGPGAALNANRLTIAAGATLNVGPPACKETTTTRRRSAMATGADSPISAACRR